MTTEPDPDEVRAREGIVEDWTKLRARKRTARVAALALATVSLVVGAGALLMRVSGAGPGAVETTSAGSGGPLAAESALPSTAGPVPSASAEPTTATAVTSATSVYPATNPVHSARGLVPRQTVGARPTVRPAPKGSVNHLLDTRD
jgi:hypothetical protein